MIYNFCQVHPAIGSCVRKEAKQRRIMETRATTAAVLEKKEREQRDVLSDVVRAAAQVQR